MTGRRRAISDAPGNAESLAERPPKSRAVTWLGFTFLLLLVALFVRAVLGEKPVNVPHGLLGARFGMSPDEVRRELPEAKAAPDGSLALETRLFEASADCRFRFESGELARIECGMRPNAGEHLGQVSQRVVGSARQLYGDESEWTRGERELWAWRSKRATLLVISERGALRVENARR